MRFARAALLSLGLALATRVAAASGDRWLELRATPPSVESLARLLALGFETKLVPPGDEDAPPGTYAVFVPADELPALSATGVPFVIRHSDLTATYRSRLGTAPSPGATQLGSGSMGGYFTFAEAVAEMEKLVAAYPTLVTPKATIGSSHEGRPIWAWKLSANAAVDEDEPEIVIVALMHAREPAGMMSLLYTAEQLLAGYGSDAEASYLLDHREIWLVPVLNPDGYVWNETQAPGGGGMWRKNRRDNGDGTRGVDINRNFGYEWGHDDLGSSPAPASDTYRGPGPFSEPETAALRDFVIARAPTVAINTHTYADVLIRPWDYADLLCADDAVFEDLSRAATRGSAYATGNVQQTLGYLANGGHDDYMYGEVVAKPRVYSLTPELGNSVDGFWPPPSRILPIAAEAYAQNLLFTWVAGPAPRLESVVVDDSQGGDGDGVAEPGESVRLEIALRNHGVLPSYGALAAVLASAGCEVRVQDGAADYGVVAEQTTVANAADPFTVRIAATAEPGALVTLDLRLGDARGVYPTIPVKLLIGAPGLAFADDFESGTALWTLKTFGNQAAGAGKSGSALSDSTGGDYGNNADATAEIKATFDFSAVRHAYLAFAQRFWIDNDYDAGFVEVSSDGGGSWTAVAGEASDAPSGVGVQAAGTRVYDGHLYSWSEERVDLTPWCGPGFDAVKLRFRFRSDGAIREDGWHIDDVRLLTYGASVVPATPRDPRPLRAVRKGGDVVLTWPDVLADPGHGPADAFVLYRAGDVHAAGGFAPRATVLALATTDAGAAAASASYAYQAVALNCAGPSSQPPP